MANVKSLAELVTDDPAIVPLREWVAAAPIECEILPPSSEREATLLAVQVTTRSVLGALAYDTGGYWGPDALEWEPLRVGLSGLLHGFLTDRLAKFYGDLRWREWREDVGQLPGDRCFAFYPFLWTKEGSLEGSRRAAVPVQEAFDFKVDIARQLGGGA